MRRHILGILAVGMTITGVALLAAEANRYLASSCWRIGLVLAALWLAMPQLQQFSRWFRRAAIVVAIVAAALSKYALVLLPLIFLMWIFGGRKREENPAKHAGGKPSGGN